MKEQDALMAVISRIDGAGPLDKVNYEWRVLAIEAAIRFIYSIGLEINETRPISIEH